MSAKARVAASESEARVPEAAKPMTLRQVRSFVKALRKAFPHPRTELAYRNPFTLLVAVVLSAQATDESVNRVTPALFAEAPDPASMAALGEEGIAKHIRTIGLWNAKAKAVAGLSRILVEKYGGHVPRDRAELEALPGVGRKTANVVLNVAFGEPTIAVDTHVFRVANRTGLALGKTPLAVEEALLARIPKELLHDAHHLLILHGRYVCKARRPECWRCVAAEWCNYPDKTPAAKP